MFQAVDAHSGYDFPWSLQNWFPLWAGAEHVRTRPFLACQAWDQSLTFSSPHLQHDYHHQSFQDCYSSSLRWLDTLLGTDQKYHKFRNAQKQAKLEAEAKKAL